MEKPPLHLPTPAKAVTKKKPAPSIPGPEKEIYKAWKQAYKEGKYSNKEYLSNDCPKWKSYSNFLEDAIKMWAKAHGAMATKIDVRGTFRDGRYTTTKATKGVEDIQLVLQGGRFVAIEVKAGADKASPEQVKRQLEYKAKGVPYHIVRNLFEFVQLIQQYL
jgi:hypothetical protein